MTEQKAMQEMSANEKIVMRVSVNSLIANGVLSIFKLTAGIMAHSGAMVSDAVHSASDVFSTIVVMIGYHMSEKESDEEHPYGHERLECIAAILLAVLLFATGAGIGTSGLKSITGEGRGLLAVPGKLAWIAALISIAVKEGMYWYTRAAAQKIHSSALLADAWHHRSDALSSVGSLIGIVGARMGYVLCDPVAGIGIAILIMKSAGQIFLDAVARLTDRACDKATEERIRAMILQTEGVCGIDRLQTRLFGSKIYVDVEIRADGTLSLLQAHSIAERVHDEIEHSLHDVKHCMVHVNPTGRDE